LPTTRRPGDIPPPSVVRDWHARGFIRKTSMRKIAQGLVCTP
jgi:hypothetical protein